MHFGFIPKDEADGRIFEKAFKEKGINVSVMSEPAHWMRVDSGVRLGYFNRQRDFGKFMAEEYTRVRRNVSAADLDASGLDMLFMRKLEEVYPVRNESDEFIFDYAQMLERDGVPVINPAPAIRCACRKHVTYHILSKAGVPVPKSFASNDAARAFLEADNLGFPHIMKPVDGRGGSGVAYIKDEEECGDMTSVYGLFKKPVIVQEYLGGEGDVRVLVAGENVLGAVERRNAGGMHKSNATLGAETVALELDDELSDIALKSAKAIGLGVAGVDVIRDGGAYRVIEVNASPAFSAFNKAMGMRAEEKIADYLITEAAR